MASSPSRQAFYPVLLIMSIQYFGFGKTILAIRSDPRTNQTSDLKGLALIALDLSITKANQSLSYAQHLLLFQSSSNYTQYKKKCLRNYNQELSEAVENLQDSTQAPMNSTFDNINDFVSSAMTDSQTRDECFNEEHEANICTSIASADDDIDDRTLAAINEDFNKLCSNFLSITILLT
ncbi:hypothetical protein LguiB_016544 [Lonicera macranthoides]